MSHSAQAAALAARHHESLYSFALALAHRDRQEAWEIVQQVYVEILEGRADLESARNPKNFLLGVARRVAASRRRRAAVGRFLGLSSTEPSIASLDPDPESRAERSELRARINRTFEELPPRQLEVATLVFAQELTIEEAAEAMGVSLGAARRHYHRAKQKLAALWEQKHDPR